MEIKITPNKTIITGTVYVVMCHHYMGMDGDFYTSVCAYTHKEDAARVCRKMELESDHVNSPYDGEDWFVEELYIKA